ncbi:RNA polymerase sigma factor, sigma-70 family [Verrucomicrobiia bacterium DG1235]|nr:RNA polymerase sigma factor, sigma-70 family [Verrucomicrobiae bacterium DG1235]
MEAPRTDQDLLKDFAQKSDQAAFTTLVERHLKLVYSVAHRILNGDTHLAEDVSQQVFADLARKSNKLARHQNLPAWLYTSARFAAAKTVRTRARRAKREKASNALLEMTTEPSTDLLWENVKPFIDEAVDSLPDPDKTALILRYYEQQDYHTIGKQIGASPNTARMKVQRALQKLEHSLSKRGITSTSAALATAISANAMTAAPNSLALAIAAQTSQLAIATATSSIIAAAGWPVAATIAIVAIGLNTTPTPAPQPDPATSSLLAEPTITQPPALASVQAPHSPDPIELAYAALDRDAQLLTQMLTKIDEKIARKINAPVNREKTYNFAELDTKPRILKGTPPKYPTSHDGTKVAGSVVVEIVLDKNGIPQSFTTLKATHPDFAESALEALKEWKFDPGSIQGLAVNSRVKLPIKFTPSDEGPNFQDWF